MAALQHYTDYPQSCETFHTTPAAICGATDWADSV